jgi:hypothetical protein
MMRFFFDYTTHNQSLYDYSGDEFPSCQSAIEFALTTAQVLNHSLAREWAGWSIEVRSADGQKVFSLPVGASASLAA